MGGCLVVLIMNLLLIIINAGCTGHSCPGGWPNGRMFSIAGHSIVFNYYECWSYRPILPGWVAKWEDA